jgi:hypothetical protein
MTIRQPKYNAIPLDAVPSVALRADVRCSTRLEPGRLRAAKKACTTHFVADAVASEPHRWSVLSGSDVAPVAGDVVLARVAGLGQHQRLESPHSRRQTLFPGDEVLVAYGHRYAPDQFEAEVPADLGPVHLIAAGGPGRPRHRAARADGRPDRPRAARAARGPRSRLLRDPALRTRVELETYQLTDPAWAGVVVDRAWTAPVSTETLRVFA